MTTTKTLDVVEAELDELRAEKASIQAWLSDYTTQAEEALAKDRREGKTPFRAASNSGNIKQKRAQYQTRLENIDTQIAVIARERDGMRNEARRYQLDSAKERAEELRDSLDSLIRSSGLALQSLLTVWREFAREAEALDELNGEVERAGLVRSEDDRREWRRATRQPLFDSGFPVTFDSWVQLLITYTLTRKYHEPKFSGGAREAYLAGLLPDLHDYNYKAQLSGRVPKKGN